jgi:preprotein translocase subunit YajC
MAYVYRWEFDGNAQMPFSNLLFFFLSFVAIFFFPSWDRKKKRKRKRKGAHNEKTKRNGVRKEMQKSGISGPLT